jgi:phosphoribosyl 1,2-cyclic phosphodiesterase
MEICVLASGSNGNAIYVGSPKSGAGILLDCGISRRQIKLRLEEKGKSLEKIDAIFLTHEHSDHVLGLRVTCKYYPIPVYLTRGTWQGLTELPQADQINFIDAQQPVRIRDIFIQPLPKAHDAREPVAFLIELNGSQLLYATDFGAPNPEIIRAIQSAHAILLETNYDPAMLENGPYPEYLKQRIRSNHGHMSNFHSAQLIRDFATPALKHLILGHLSENNNHPELALQAVQEIIRERADLNPKIHVASRYAAGELIQL